MNVTINVTISNGVHEYTGAGDPCRVHLLSWSKTARALIKLESTVGSASQLHGFFPASIHILASILTRIWALFRSEPLDKLYIYL